MDEDDNGDNVMMLVMVSMMTGDDDGDEMTMVMLRVMTTTMVIMWMRMMMMTLMRRRSRMRMRMRMQMRMRMRMMVMVMVTMVVMVMLVVAMRKLTPLVGLQSAWNLRYTNVDVQPVRGLDGIRTLNPGPESSVTPVYLWHNLIEHLSPNYNCMAFNYDWRRWGDLLYVDELQKQFQQTIERAVKIAGGLPVTLIGHSMGAQAPYERM
eukprot:s8542_g1.t1